MNGELFSSTTPPLPPTTEDDRISRLRLLRSKRVGIVTYNRLISEHGSASNALAALPEVAKSKGLTRYEPFSEKSALAEIKAAKRYGALARFIGEPSYPKQLAQITDAPPFIWTVGRQKYLDCSMIAIVGARNASSLGTRMAAKLAHELGEAGFVIASGLARGVDAAAHNAALNTGTVAVQAGGVDIVYPQENADLAKRILQYGARISEQPMGLQPLARHFPRRNRIISGICDAVVVIEASGKSGTLITAQMALDQGRDVLAVPGHPFDGRAEGCNRLIRDGATLVRNTDDILQVLESPRLPLASPQYQQPTPSVQLAAEPKQKPIQPRNLRETAALHQLILNRIGPSPIPEDQLIRDLAQPSSLICAAVSELEIDGSLERQTGGMISKIPLN